MNSHRVSWNRNVKADETGAPVLIDSGPYMETLEFQKLRFVCRHRPRRYSLLMDAIEALNSADTTERNEELEQRLTVQLFLMEIDLSQMRRNYIAEIRDTLKLLEDIPDNPDC